MILDLIEKKIDGKALTQSDFDIAIDYLMKRGIDNLIVKFFYTLNDLGMSKDEVLFLANSIRDSGRVLHFEETIFEKHSTGGVGDPSSLVIVPLLASLGYKIIKTTGRSLSFTNGSADRFKSIPNFSARLDYIDINNALNKTNACILSHNNDMCPVDKILYDLRERYGMVENINFIASSISAKKMSSGANVVLIDIKYGTAGIVKKYKDAKRLAKLFKYIFSKNNIKSVCLITNTLQTLGSTIGNAVEVVDALNVLQGQHSFLRKIANKYAVELLCCADNHLNKSDAYDMVNVALDSGSAYKQFLKIIDCQGGDCECFKNATIFKPYHSVNFIAVKQGYVGCINSYAMAEIVRCLCANNHDDNIGIVLRVKLGDFVQAGDVVLSFYYKEPKDLEEYKDILENTVRLTDLKTKKIRVVKKVIK